MKTTPAHFVLFRKQVLSWLDRFGLIGWEPNFDHENSNIEGQNSAVAWDVEGRTCTFFLHLYANPPLDVKQEAFHVVGHLFLAKLTGLAMDRHMAEGDLKEELNAILRTQKNMIL